MKVRYIGEDFNLPVGLRSGKAYECIGIEYGLLRILDEDIDEPQGVLYSARNPRPLDGSSTGGRWEIVEDDEQGTLKNAIGL